MSKRLLFVVQFVVAAIALTLPGSGCAQTVKTQPSAVAPNPTGATEVAATAPAVEIPPRPESPRDESQFRRFVLENGLHVILLSDPKLNKSSASMAVAVGSLSDPPQRQGLAHFLEHMLFLGTEKFPDVAGYTNYLQTNGGYANAYTSGDHTNYQFEIRSEALEGALDRFAQFFIAPLFTPEFTEREANAVNSENQKNLENDDWREYQLRNSLYRAGHPANHFSTGNHETLRGTTRDELLAFYRQHYSANQMWLAVAGTAGLDQLEQWVRTYFSPVENRRLEAIHFPPDYLVPKPALRLVFREPVKDLRQLTLEFPLPDTRRLWESKPQALVSFILGNEGEGSLLSRLKAEGLATGLGAATEDPTSDYSSFNVSVALTPEGLKKYERVLQLFFATVADLRRSGYPSYLFRERQRMAQLDETYQDKGEGAQRAVFLANHIREYPFEFGEREPYLWLKEDPAAYAMILAHLRPDNMLAMLTAKGLPTDATEPYYGTRYSYREQTGAEYAALLQAAPVAGIHLPAANPFVPERASVLPEEPVRLLDEPGLSLYYSKDAEFLRPMVAQLYRVRLPRNMGNLENAVLLRFYEACVNEALNETAYTASVAGLDFNLSAGLEGVVITLGGYDESAGRLLDRVAGSLVEFELSDERFAAIKDRILREMANFTRADAWQILRESRNAAMREFYFRPDEQLPVAQKIDLNGVREFARRLYAHGKIEALIHGNVAARAAIAAARKLADTLQVAPVPDAELLRRRLLAMTPGESIRSVEQLAVNNSAYRSEFLLGDDAPETRAATQVLSNFIDEPFYSELRTRQQLGYIVAGGAGSEEHTNYTYFIIQSGEHPADELAARATAFVEQLPAMLTALPDEAWQTILGGARAQLEEKDKTIADRAMRLFNLAYDFDGDWNRREETLAALDHLTKQRAAEILAAALAPDARRQRTFLGFAREHKSETDVTPTFTDRGAWKQTRNYN